MLARLFSKYAAPNQKTKSPAVWAVLLIRELRDSLRVRIRISMIPTPKANCEAAA